MSWVLTTTETAGWKFYVIGPDGEVAGLASHLDDPHVSRFNTKQDAKEAAKKAGITTWKYLDLNAKPRSPR